MKGRKRFFSKQFLGPWEPLGIVVIEANTSTVEMIHLLLRIPIPVLTISSAWQSLVLVCLVGAAAVEKQDLSGCVALTAMSWTDSSSSHCSTLEGDRFRRKTGN